MQLIVFHSGHPTAILSIPKEEKSHAGICAKPEEFCPAEGLGFWVEMSMARSNFTFSNQRGRN